MPEEKTIEELMQEIVSLQDKVTALEEENNKNKEDLVKANDTLDKTRKLNSDLLNRMPITGVPKEETVEDSFEKLMEETIDKFRLKKV